MTRNEERCLRWVLAYGEKHLDSRGARQWPNYHKLNQLVAFFIGPVMGLEKKGYLKITPGEKVTPTAKAEVWWKENKFTWRTSREVK